MTAPRIVRTQDEIDELLNRASDARDQGSKFPGMSIEDGILDFYDWLIGSTDENPYPDE